MIFTHRTIPSRSVASRPSAYRSTATLHRSAPHGPSRRRRLGLGALGGGAAVAASSGLAAVLATGAYAAPQAATTSAPAAAETLSASNAHESQLAATTTATQAQRAATAAVKPAQAAHAADAARAAQAASRSETRAPLESSASFSGLASWYGPGFEGQPTASGEPYDENALTAASRTLPLGTHLQVCHDGNCVTVLINDWGPVPRSRVLDLSRAAAEQIGIYDEGVGEVTATPVG